MDAFYFWKQIDENNPYKSLKELSDICGVDYNRLKRNRSDDRLPSIEDAFSLAQAESVSVELLLTGIDKRPMSPGDKLYNALLEQAPAVLQGLIETYIEKRDTSSAPRMA